MDCALEKLVFPYEWLDSFDKLNHVGPVTYERFYSKLKGGMTITRSEYDYFVKEFNKRGCIHMLDWL